MEQEEQLEQEDEEQEDEDTGLLDVESASGSLAPPDKSNCSKAHGKRSKVGSAVTKSQAKGSCASSHRTQPRDDGVLEFGAPLPNLLIASVEHMSRHSCSPNLVGSVVFMSSDDIGGLDCRSPFPLRFRCCRSCDGTTCRAAGVF